MARPRRISALGALAALATLAAAVFGAQRAAAAPPSPVTVYACPDGSTVRARYPDPTTAVIVYRGHRHVLRTVTSASGARYVGDGLQWWTRGMTIGMISTLKAGADYAEPGPECHAPPG